MARTVRRIYCVDDQPPVQPFQAVTIRGTMTPLRVLRGNDGVDDLTRGDGMTSLGQTPLKIREHFGFDGPHWRMPDNVGPISGRAVAEPTLECQQVYPP